VFSFSDTFYGLEKIMLPHEEQIQFKLQYKEPQLESFEQKHITIDENAIKLEIEEINKKTEASCKKIKELFETLQEQSESLLDTEHAGKITRFLRNVKDIFGKTCGYLLSENSQVFFKDYQKENDVRYHDPSRVIFEAFVNSHFTGEKKTEYLQNKDIELSENEIEDFTCWVKEKSAKFDVGMYQDISVTVNEKNHIQILLHENTGEVVPLEQTSAGRRWYFTYCFVKDTLSRGDTFIIDEPAAMLHPSAQKEIMSDLIDLVKKCGIKVIYSTHSPYLIPNEWSCVKFVSLCEETSVTDFDLSTEEFKQFKALSSIDIFGYEEISDYYRKSSFKPNITKGIYEKLIKTFSTNKEISEHIGIEERTLYNWQSAKKQISINNKKTYALMCIS
jgi:predicted ATPase